MNVKRVGLYLRTSSTERTVENQRQALTEALTRRGWQIAEEFTDEGVSGAKGRDKRPGFDRLSRRGPSIGSGDRYSARPAGVVVSTAYRSRGGTGCAPGRCDRIWD